MTGAPERQDKRRRATRRRPRGSEAAEVWLSQRGVKSLAILGAQSATLGGGQDRAIASAVNEGHVAEHIQPSKMRQFERQESAVNVVGDGDAAIKIEGRVERERGFRRGREVGSAINPPGAGATAISATLRGTTKAPEGSFVYRAPLTLSSSEAGIRKSNGVVHFWIAFFVLRTTRVRMLVGGWRWLARRRLLERRRSVGGSRRSASLSFRITRARNPVAKSKATRSIAPSPLPWPRPPAPARFRPVFHGCDASPRRSSRLLRRSLRSSILFAIGFDPRHVLLEADTAALRDSAACWRSKNDFSHAAILARTSGAPARISAMSLTMSSLSALSFASKD